MPVQIAYDVDGKERIETAPWFIGTGDAERYADHQYYKALSLARANVDEGLTQAEQQDAINNAWLLCRANPAFLGHEYMQIRLKKGGRTRFNQWTPGQKQLYMAVLRAMGRNEPVRIVILKSRRQGVSTLVELLAFWRTAFYQDANAMIVAHEDKSAAAIYRMFGLYLDSLPDPLSPMMSTDNSEQIVFDNPKRADRKKNPGLGSSIQQRTVALGGGSKEKQGKGRGDTLHFIHGSESAFWAEPEQFWTGMSQCVDESVGTFIFLESTANGYGWFRDMWVAASEGWDLKYDTEKNKIEWKCLDPHKSKSSLVPLFLSWLEEPTYRWPFKDESERIAMERSLEDDEKNLIENFGADFEQINWRRRILHGEKFNGDIQRFNQEYPTTPDEAFISTGRKVFSVAALKWAENQIRQSEVTGRRVDFWLGDDGSPKQQDNEYGTCTIWREPVPGATYAIGVDGSYGKQKGDSTCIQVLRCDSWEQVAKVHGIIADDEAARISTALHRYYNGAVTVVEINGPGHSIQTKMDELGCENFYFRVTPDDSTGKPSKSFGWWTSTKTRTNMVSRLREAVRDMKSGNGLILHDVETVRQMMSWVIKPKPGGRSKEEPAGSSDHDDSITAIGIALVGGVIEEGYGAPIISQPSGNVASINEYNPLLNLPWKHATATEFHPVLGANA